jgi:membrane protein implicated in regulation of membrane protease activity
MPAWLVWLIAAALLGVVELTTLTFVAGLMASAAVVSAVVAAAGGGLVPQVLAFALASFAALALVFPFATRRRRGRLRGAGSYRSGVEGLIDRPAVVIEQVDGMSGVVRIGGELWSARAYDQTQVIAEGTRVAVFQIDGATALVYPREFA